MNSREPLLQFFFYHLLCCLPWMLGFVRIVDSKLSGTRHLVGQGFVQTGAPQGDYSGPRRPQVHFSPPKGFMNDPNGMFIDEDGVYHLYYQYNPQGLIAANAHWGHATSRDLYRWANEPIALSPSAEGEAIFTGSIVVDANNTSGFFPNQTNGVVALYTLHTIWEQTQDIAYSRDGGYTFTKYYDNPVISIKSTEFRDPKVIWHSATSKWVAVIAFSQDYAVGIFTSSDLKTWEHASNFSHAGFLGLNYECPNLIQIPMLKNASAVNPFQASNFAELPEPMWLLLVSINPGAPQGGSISQYFPGTFNGTHFSPVDRATRLSDFAKDNYAGQFFYGIEPNKPQISMAWASNWQYANVVPTAEEGFRSTMSLPRLHVLANITRAPYTLISTPVPLKSLHTTTHNIISNASLVNRSMTLAYAHLIRSRALSLEIRFRALPLRPMGSLDFSFFSSQTGEGLRGGFIFNPDPTFFIDRGGLHGFSHPLFTSQFSAAHEIDPSTRALDLQIVLDRGIVEVFLDGGARSATLLYFAEGELDILNVESLGISGGVEVMVEVWGLESVWQGEKSSSAADEKGSWRDEL